MFMLSAVDWVSMDGEIRERKINKRSARHCIVMLYVPTCVEGFRSSKLQCNRQGKGP